MPDDHKPTSGAADDGSGGDEPQSADVEAGSTGASDSDPHGETPPADDPERDVPDRSGADKADEPDEVDTSDATDSVSDDAEPAEAGDQEPRRGHDDAEHPEPDVSESDVSESAAAPEPRASEPSAPEPGGRESDAPEPATPEPSAAEPSAARAPAEEPIAPGAPASSAGASPGMPRPQPSERFTPKAPSGLSHLGKAMTKRPTLRHFIVAVLLAVVGFAGVVQVRGDEADVLEGARRDELGRILVDLTRQGDRLEDEVRELEQTRRELRTSSDSESVAQNSAEERLQQLKVLTGEVPATGPGIKLDITGPIKASTMLTTVAELRAAGAEAIQITGDEGASVRVVVSTYFEEADTDDAVNISGETVHAPFTILAIGDPTTLAPTVEFPNGIRYQVNEDGADVIVSESESLTIDTLHQPSEPEYAHPAPNDEEE